MCIRILHFLLGSNFTSKSHNPALKVMIGAVAVAIMKSSSKTYHSAELCHMNHSRR